MSNANRSNVFWIPIIVGLVLIIAGLVIPTQGGALTTWWWMDGETTDDYVFDDRYSAIDEYITGDAYNYIIGASLVAGKISGTMTTKAVFIATGVLCACIGWTAMLFNKSADSNNSSNDSGVDKQPQIQSNNESETNPETEVEQAPDTDAESET